jgi:hypothetical protein
LNEGPRVAPVVSARLPPEVAGVSSAVEIRWADIELRMTC